MNKKLQKNIVSLIKMFDCDDGVSEDTFSSVIDLFRDFFGKEAAIALSQHIDATDNRFYIKSGAFKQVCKDVLGKVHPSAIIYVLFPKAQLEWKDNGELVVHTGANKL